MTESESAAASIRSFHTMVKPSGALACHGGCSKNRIRSTPEGEEGKELVFDLNVDPNQTKNLASQKPEICVQL